MAMRDHNKLLTVEFPYIPYIIATSTSVLCKMWRAHKTINCRAHGLRISASVPEEVRHDVIFK